MTCSRLRMLSPLFFLALTACRVTDVPFWGPADPLSTSVVETRRGIVYYRGPDFDAHAHQLDMYLPKGQKDFPVVVLVHGGAWLMGDNRCCGLYSSVGEFLASQGIGVVMPNYRLSPQVKHPEHVKDLARAVAWTKAHIGEFGGRSEKLYLAGHSAGGHMVALLATDERYLRAEKLSIADIQGVIALSGVYRIPAEKLDVTLFGAGPRAFRFDEAAPLRGDSSSATSWFPGIPLSIDVFAPAFGRDRQCREDASPVCHVRPGLPPFLLLSADHDLPTLPGMAEEFQQELNEHGCDARLQTIARRNHNSIVFTAVTRDDPVARAILDFVASTSGRVGIRP